ncbi:MAG: septum formation family protein [Marmoricola sp.]
MRQRLLGLPGLLGACVGVCLGSLLLAACGNPFHHDDASDRRTPPALGACRDLSAADLTEPSNADAVVPCTRDHTAQTFAIGTLPASTGTSWTDRRHGTWIYTTCTRAFQAFVGADDSLAMRSQLSWAWFRPSQRGWDRGARWYRCDVVGGPPETKHLRDLPTDAKGLLLGAPPDAWMTCALGPAVAGSTKVPCTETHTWRAVTTVKVGLPTDPYPGDRIVEVRSRDYCQESVGGWMHYPPAYDYGFTWFKEDRWSIGNRRSICWAKTTA